MIKPDFIICHYGEIALKRGNRQFFEKVLLENIKKSLASDEYQFLKRIPGRIIIKLGQKADEEKITEKLKKVFGLEDFAFAFSGERNMDSLKNLILKVLREKNFGSFSVRAKRGDKSFPLTSQEVNQELGKYILDNINSQVNLEKPDLTCFIEIVEDYAFLYFEKVSGLGGLPVGSNGKVVSLLSGGIDSPVASFYIMSRGLKVVYLHCYTDIKEKTTLEKSEKIAKRLKSYQGESRLYLVPFLDIQKEMFKKIKPTLTCIVCRRLMLKIGEIVAEKEGAEGLVTGENIGQVASQTLPNIRVSESAVSLPVFKPLIAFSKKDIIEKSKELGLFQISVLKDNFYCRNLISKHPETKANLDFVKKEEKKIDFQRLIKKALTNKIIKEV
jgi:tRNA uracil 4-sulfurtransferase